MSDPVAEKSGFLKMYMSGHPDTLVAYAKWYGKVEEPITSAEMTAIDTKSMTLTCSLKDGNKKVVRVAIDPPLAGYDDVKPRLLEMKAISQEGLGMIKSPKISSFYFPPTGYAIAVVLFGLVPYFGFAPSEGSSPLLIPAEFVRSYISAKAFKILFGVVVGIHMLEGLYSLSLCRRHKASFSVTSAYFAATMVLGMPVWKDLRKRIQDVRINSVMKVE
ncbi:hypothetical protein FB45DRAFT_900616 [Roridomyces roridus]|uniref:DUF2470 domain-containing protein n=1 Tax=Roridomyces roridus TaxID=1738132 RepID=A0AAD7C873_9AGAR|nr:hypothetical protein FB45DRAFT_900616 [Roridomyces roridus]